MVPATTAGGPYSDQLNYLPTRWGGVNSSWPRVDHLHPPTSPVPFQGFVNRRTDTTENITFPRTMYVVDN